MVPEFFRNGLSSWPSLYVLVKWLQGCTNKWKMRKHSKNLEQIKHEIPIKNKQEENGSYVVVVWIVLVIVGSE